MKQNDDYCTKCPFTDDCNEKDEPTCLVKVLTYEAELGTHPTWKVEKCGKQTVLKCPYCGYVRDDDYQDSHGKPPFCEHCGSDLRSK